MSATFIDRSISRIIGMCETRSASEVAGILRMDEEDVLDILARAGRPTKANWVVRCNKSGRTFRARSQRGAYRTAMLQGLTDWDYVLSEAQEPPARTATSTPTAVRNVITGPERNELILNMKARGASLRQIAEAVGVSSPAILKHMQRHSLTSHSR